jgi:hypothetical protein
MNEQEKATLEQTDEIGNKLESEYEVNAAIK